MSKIPSIESLHKEKNIKDNSKCDIFKIVLNKCVEKVVYTNRHTDKTFVIFEVPSILIGYPMYDMKSCIMYIMSKLSQSGYIVEFIEPFYLYIDWGSSVTSVEKPLIPTSRPERLRKQTRELLQKFPETSKVEYVYQDSSIKHKKKKGKR